MSDPAAPWWADVQHLRPREHHAAEPPAPPVASSAPARRFARGAAEHDAATATLEHEIADPWATEDAVAPWAETLDQSYEEHAPGDPSPAGTATLWDDSLEEAFARTPSWADVQHLRPREGRAAEAPAVPTPSSAPARRFARGAVGQRDATTATLEHEIADPWASEDAVAPWAETLAQAHEEHASGDQGTADTTALWDDSLEEAFARTPSWADEDDPRLLPKGADRIENGRRTIEIRGQVDRIHGFTAPAETQVATRGGGRRAARRPSDRFERRPDRVAMWAFLLGLLLICVAAFSKPGDADASVRAAAQAPAAHVATLAADGTLARR